MTGDGTGKTAPRWGVVGVLDEPAVVVAAYVAHYLWLGAHDIHLLFDRPRPDLAALLDGRARVRWTVLDAAFWARAGVERPERFGLRQTAAVTAAYRASAMDWLLHVDADEFVFPDRPMDEIVAGVPDGVVNILAETSERVRLAGRDESASIFGRVFRKPVEVDPARVEALWGAAGELLSEAGLLGHAIGKSLVRTGLDLRIEAHFGVAPGLRPGIGPVLEWALDHAAPFPGRLCHFDAMTPLQWQLKLLRRAEATAAQKARKADALRPRLRQVLAMRAGARDAGAAMDLVQRVITLDPAQEAYLRGMGAVETFEHGIEARTRAAFPEIADFSEAAFDAALRVQRAEVLAAHGLA